MTLVRLPRPATDQDFEDLALSVVRHLWKDPTASLLGRRGQRQYGVDAFGLARHLDKGHAVAQFRNVARLTEKEIVEVLGAMDAGLPPPSPRLFTIVTAAPRDARLQLELRALSEPRRSAGKSELLAVFWEDIERILRSDDVLLRQHYPDLAPRKLSAGEECRLRAQNALVMRLRSGGTGFESVEGRPVFGCEVVNDGETPFVVASAAASWWFTEEFLTLEPGLAAGKHVAAIAIPQPSAPPGSVATVQAFVDPDRDTNARLWRTIPTLRAVCPLQARVQVTATNAAGTAETAGISLAWPTRR